MKSRNKWVSVKETSKHRMLIYGKGVNPRIYAFTIDNVDKEMGLMLKMQYFQSF